MGVSKLSFDFYQAIDRLSEQNCMQLRDIFGYTNSNALILESGLPIEKVIKIESSNLSFQRDNGIYIHLYTSIYIYIRLNTSIYIYIHLYTSKYICIHLYTSIYIYIHLYTSIYIYIHLHTSILTYIQTTKIQVKSSKRQS